MKVLQAVTGMKDILPSESPVWRYVEAQLSQVLSAYAYKEMRFPMMEETRLFKRGIGETTDIVEKEMYSFEDRSGESLTLRPEGTASCVRACLQHNLLFDRGTLTQKLWYSGPMFRHEKPQKGRLRQFHQFGVEAFGYDGPDIDAELLIMTARLWKVLKISDAVTLEINSLGTAEARLAHRRALIDYFQQHKASLDEDSLRRLDKNPLRIFDSKHEATQEIVKAAPALEDFLDEASQTHFTGLKAILDAANIPYRVNPRLVRGLDYYSKTVFEWVTTKLGSQGTVCAGGRYDSLVQELGGKPTPAIGFGIGVERLILLLDALNAIPAETYGDLDVYIVATGNAYTQAVALAEKIHDEQPQLRVQTNTGGGSFRAQMKKADRSGARIALILGEEEIKQQQVVVKYLREERDQAVIKQNDITTIWV